MSGKLSLSTHARKPANLAKAMLRLAAVGAGELGGVLPQGHRLPAGRRKLAPLRRVVQKAAQGLEKDNNKIMESDVEQSTYKFTNEWFPTAAKGVWDVLVPQFNPTKILEIGSYEGAATCYLIDSQSKNNDIEVHCIDIWEEQKEEGEEISIIERRFHHNTNLAISKAHKKVEFHIHKGPSDIELPKLLAQGMKNYFDFIYIDGAHEAPDVLCDAVLSFRLLRPYGLMVFDDYLWSEQRPLQNDPIRCPKVAIDAFVNLYCRKLSVVRAAPLYQLYVHKLSD